MRDNLLLARVDNTIAAGIPVSLDYALEINYAMTERSGVSVAGSLIQLHLENNVAKGDSWSCQIGHGESHHQESFLGPVWFLTAKTTLSAHVP